MEEEIKDKRRREKPWEELEELILLDKAEDIQKYIDELDTADVVSAMNHISAEQRTQLLGILAPESAATLVEEIPWSQALEALKDLGSENVAAIITEIPSDEQADFISEMDDERAQAVLEKLDNEQAENVRQLIQYDPDTAGGLMITEFLSFEEDLTVSKVVKELSDNADKYNKYNLQYIYVTRRGAFVGVLNMRSLVLSKPNTLLSTIVVENALTIDEYTPIEELIRFFDEYDFYGVPVINRRNQLKGVVLRKDLREAQTDRMNEEHLETQGIVGGEELRTMPIWLRSKRRLSWLSVNILLNIFAASVIAIYQDTLSAVIALAVFLPIISDMSGCSGNQAVAVSMRELSLGVVRPFEVMRVWIQEISVGLINGTVLGLLIGLAAWIWKGNIYLGLVVGGALAVNTLVAVSLGGVIPLVLKRMNIDPALASGPLLTTITDMFGFFLALTFAAGMMNYLV